MLVILGLGLLAIAYALPINPSGIGIGFELGARALAAMVVATGALILAWPALK
jgi:hypothetical protein